jgi:cell wall-associated NlpC family hydrolase
MIPSPATATSSPARPRPCTPARGLGARRPATAFGPVRLSALVAALLLLAGALPAWASPGTTASAPAEAASSARGGAEGDAGDALLQLLHDRGLLSHAAVSQAYPVLRDMRHAASELVVSAMNFVGVRYRRGGNSADEGFDCSGFTRHVFENSLGLVLPRRAEQQASRAGLLEVARDELRPGDLVFFNTMRRAFSHVGIYVGDGKFIHAPRSGASVRIEDMRDGYWTRRFDGARRAAIASAGAAGADPAGSPRH